MDSLFVSGPFTGFCPPARRLVRRVARAHGLHVIEKHGGVERSVAQLIEDADRVLFVYGAQEPAIRDVYDHTLVELELGYAAVRRKRAVAVLLGHDGPLPHHIGQLRRRLEHQLGGAAVTLAGLRDRGELDATGHLLFDVVLEHALARHSGEPIPDSFRRERLRPLAAETAERLLDPAAGPALVEDLIHQAGQPVPTPAQLQPELERVERLLADAAARARPVFNDRVFLSYARLDRVPVRALEEALQAQQLEPWRDENGLLAGEQFTQILFDRIESSGAFVVWLTPRAADSRWVHKEVAHALAQQGRYGADVYQVLPVRVGDTPADAVPALADRHQLHLPDPSTGLADLAARLHAEIERQRRGRDGG